MNGKCEDCIYFVPEDVNSNLDGRCHFNAPQMVCGAGTGWTPWEWPPVSKTTFCAQGVMRLRTTCSKTRG